MIAYVLPFPILNNDDVTSNLMPENTLVAPGYRFVTKGLDLLIDLIVIFDLQKNALPASLR
jgi:hypothetical protein